MERGRPALRFEMVVALLAIFALLETAMIWWRIRAAPLAWICLVWLVVAVVLFVKDRRPVGKLIWPNLAAVLLAVGAVEGALYIGKHSNPYLMPPGVRFVGDMARPNYFIEMPVEGLGYRPRSDMRIQAVKMQRDAVIYSVRYSVGADGLRAAPPAPAAPRACVFMFGDSMAWGEGVDDEQTAAFQIGLLADASVKVSNFAFTGYSAHQMLWQSIAGEVAARSGCPAAAPVLAIYQTLPNNVARVAGLRGWDEFGPRYVMGDGGKLRYAGSFARGDMVLHDRYRVPAPLSTELDRINLYSRIVGRDRSVDGFDYERFSRVVQSAAANMRANFPRLQFVVLVWPEPGEAAGDPSSGTALMVASMKRHGIEAMTIDTIIPWYRVDPARAAIAGDGHPNGTAHRLIAQYFAPRAARLASAASPVERTDALAKK